jgi:SAM-dependent methyltransferase
MMDGCKKKYFESMSQFGGISLHTGGLNRTCELLIKARVPSGSHILEIGSGSGGSSRFILEAGFDLTSVEPNKALLDTTVSYCKSTIGRTPHAINAKIEDARLLESFYDCALMECVFGFIEDKSAALQTIHNALKKGCFLCVNDFYYHTPPDEVCLRELNTITDGHISYMRKSDYLELFEEHGFVCISWQDIAKVPNEQFRDSDLQFMSEEEKVTFGSATSSWIDVFEKNKKYTNAFLGLWMRIEKEGNK